MEEHDQHKDEHHDESEQASQPPKPKGIMDIQRPRPQHQDAKPEFTEPVAEPNHSATIEVSEGGEIKPAYGGPESEHKTPEVIQQHIEEEHKKAEEHQLLAAKGKHKSGKPIFVILLAVVFALGLAGVAVYAYMQSNEAKSPSNTSKTESTAQPATATDVDDASKDVDDAISSVDDTQDLPESDLTDQTLGL